MENLRQVEEGVTRDLRGKQTYAGYLDLDRLLSAQHPISQPQHHDELLFIVQHQTSELWMKLIIHELDAVLRFLAEDELGPAQKGLARVKQIQRQLFEQWGVLATLTPSSTWSSAAFSATRPDSSRCSTGSSSSCSATRTARCPKVFGHVAGVTSGGCERCWRRRGLYDEFLRYLARGATPVPADCVDRDSASPTGAARPAAGVQGDLRGHRTRLGPRTRRARSSWTWRRASSSGASGT